MKKIDLVNELARCLEVSRREAEMILDTILSAISHAVKRGERVEVRRFGVFQSSRRSGRKVRNPRTGAITHIGPKRTAVFRASRPLLKVLNGGERNQTWVTEPSTRRCGGLSPDAAAAGDSSQEGNDLSMDRKRFLGSLPAKLLGWKVSSQLALASNARRPVIVSAGRRVDAPDAQVPRFPAANVPAVRRRILEFFEDESPVALVCSAACGTDLLALDVAGQRQVMRYVLLGAEPAVFRRDSVTDRPGNWGEMFDQVMKSAIVQVLKLPAGQKGYLQTNLDLLNRAEALARQYGTSVQAMVVWNQESRGPGDVTGHFLLQAKLRGIPVSEISTL